ncbi:MAG: hypothetical protein QE269_03215 [Fimbriimonas sp.]|nr:hypothetical protein [Fimbriimonas sp.]
MKLITALFAIVATAMANAQQVFGDETRAWMVGPARAISSGSVNSFQYSARGNKIIYSRTDPNYYFLGEQKPPKTEWFVYDILKGQSLAIKISGLSWQSNISLLGDERTVFFTDFVDEKVQGFYNLETGAITRTSIPLGKIMYYGENPVAPFLVVSTAENAVTLVAPGRGTQSFKIEKGTELLNPTYSDGQIVKFQAYAGRNNQIVLREVTLALRTGESKVRDLKREEWDKMRSKEVKPIFELNNEAEFATLGLPPVQVPKGSPNTKPKPRPGYLERTVYVCPTRFQVQLEPSEKSIAYTDNGALLLREIRPFDHDLAEKMKIEALKAQAMSIAKQVGIALMLYAADMDEVLPNGENFVNRLTPYIKDRKMIAAFNYTYAGGPMDQIKDIANTELGFTMGPGGRAIVYADGHAKWVPDKP